MSTAPTGQPLLALQTNTEAAAIVTISPPIQNQEFTTNQQLWPYLFLVHTTR
jgi:hypothetical protein